MDSSATNVAQGVRKLKSGILKTFCGNGSSGQMSVRRSHYRFYFPKVIETDWNRTVDTEIWTDRCVNGFSESMDFYNTYTVPFNIVLVGMTPFSHFSPFSCSHANVDLALSNRTWQWKHRLF